MDDYVVRSDRVADFELAATPEDLAEAFRRQSDGHKNPKVEVKDEAGDDEEDKMDGF